MFHVRRSFVAILLVLFVSPLQAKVLHNPMVFLRISDGARPAGMGQAFVALADEPSAVWWNPAGLGFQSKSRVTASYGSWLPAFDPQQHLFQAAGTYSPGEMGTLGFGATFLDQREPHRSDPYIPDDLRSFRDYEFSFTGAYGATLCQNLAVGLALKVAHTHTIEFTDYDEQSPPLYSKQIATTVAADLGILHQSFLLQPLSVGACLSNIGPRVSFASNSPAQSLPTNLTVGAAYRMFDQEYNTVTLVSDVSRELFVQHDDGSCDPVYKSIFTAWANGPFFKTLIWNVGAEYWYNSLIGLRAGYWNDHEGKVFPYTFGASIRYLSYGIDGSYWIVGENHPLNKTWRLSITAGL